MIKLLIWGIIGYIVYRYFQMKAELKAGDKRNQFHRHEPPDRQSPPAPKNEKGGDYIDYEEVK